MTREEAIRILRKEIECMSHTKCEDCILEKVCDPMITTPFDTEYIEVYEMAIIALEQEPCDDAKSETPSEDAISRKSVLAFIKAWSLGGWVEVPESEWNEFVLGLPSVKQEPKTGRWEWVQYDYNPKLGNWHCSECRCIVVECVDKEEKGGIPLYKYCPQCGAKMESEVQE